MTPTSIGFTGIHDGLTMDQYLAIDAVSRSMLCVLGTRSAAHLKAQIDGEKKKTTKALRFGSIIDTAVFEPRKLESSVHIRPVTCKTAKGCVVPWDAKTNDAQAWLAAHQDMPIATYAELDTARAIAESVRSHPSVKLALAQGKAQQTIIVRASDLMPDLPDTDVCVKVRPDWLSGNVIVDLKSTVDGSKEEFAKSIYNYGYDVQSALYLDVCNVHSLGKEHFVFLCCEKESPYAVSVYRLDTEADMLVDEVSGKKKISSVEIGRRKYRYWLAQYCECVRSGIWPGYSPQIEVIGLSEWAKRMAA